MIADDILKNLEQTIILRLKEKDTAASYVAQLSDKGLSAIGDKVREEALELIEASNNTDNDHISHEAADLLFHTLVLLVNKGVTLESVIQKLHKRMNVSGILEKESRDGN